jgi:hypothetical protein
MCCQWCSIRSGSFPTKYSANSSTAAAVLRGFPSRVVSPQPSIPVSVVIRTRRMRRRGKNWSMRAIFIPRFLSIGQDQVPVDLDAEARSLGHSDETRGIHDRRVGQEREPVPVVADRRIVQQLQVG